MKILIKWLKKCIQPWMQLLILYSHKTWVAVGVCLTVVVFIAMLFLSPYGSVQQMPQEVQPMILAEADSPLNNWWDDFSSPEIQEKQSVELTTNLVKPAENLPKKSFSFDSIKLRVKEVASKVTSGAKIGYVATCDMGAKAATWMKGSAKEVSQGTASATVKTYEWMKVVAGKVAVEVKNVYLGLCEVLVDVSQWNEEVRIRLLASIKEAPFSAMNWVREGLGSFSEWNSSLAIEPSLQVVAIEEKNLVAMEPSQKSPQPVAAIEMPLQEKRLISLQDKKPVAVDEPEWRDNSYPYPKRISLSYVAGPPRGLGFTTNYASIDALFGPDYKPGHLLPLVDLKVQRFNNNTYAGSVGIVTRYIPKTFCQLLGFNAYYDIREGFQQVQQRLGFGLEVLSRRWDLRANVYAPLGARRQGSTCLFNQYSDGYFILNKRTECNFFGFNAEAGWLVVNSNPFLLYWASGLYVLSGKCNPNAVGYEMRIRPQIRDYFALDLSVSYDPIFKTVFEAKIFLTIPLYQLSSNKNKKAPCGMSDRQVYQPVERFDPTPISRRSCWKSNF